MRFGFFAGLLVAVIIACGPKTGARLSTPVPTAGECPQGRVVVVANTTNEEIDVIAPVTGAATDMLGVVDAGQTVTFNLPRDSNGTVRWRYSARNMFGKRRASMTSQPVHVNVRCS